MNSLHLAVKASDLKTIDNLLSQGSSIEEAEAGCTPLMLAVGEASNSTVQLLLDRGAKVNAICRDATALILSSMFGYGNVCELLLDRGADPNLADSKGNTPLMYAAEADLIGVIEVLIKHCASIDEQNKKGQTALDFATNAQQHRAACDLLAAGASVASTLLFQQQKKRRIDWMLHSAPLLSAAERGEIGLLAEMLSDPASNRNALDKSLNNLLIIAAGRGYTEMVNFLLDSGFDIDFLSTRGWTALESAVVYRHPETVKALLDRGADPTYQVNQRVSMLVRAANDSHLEVLKLLLDYAKANNVDLDIDRGIEIARRDGQSAALKLLKSYKPAWWSKFLRFPTATHHI